MRLSTVQKFLLFSTFCIPQHETNADGNDKVVYEYQEEFDYNKKPQKFYTVYKPESESTSLKFCYDSFAHTGSKKILNEDGSSHEGFDGARKTPVYALCQGLDNEVYIEQDANAHAMDLLKFMNFGNPWIAPADKPSSEKVSSESISIAVQGRTTNVNTHDSPYQFTIFSLHEGSLLDEVTEKEAKFICNNLGKHVELAKLSHVWKNRPALVGRISQDSDENLFLENDMIHGIGSEKKLCTTFIKDRLNRPNEFEYVYDSCYVSYKGFICEEKMPTHDPSSKNRPEIRGDYQHIIYDLLRPSQRQQTCEETCQKAGQARYAFEDRDQGLHTVEEGQDIFDFDGTEKADKRSCTCVAPLHSPESIKDINKNPATNQKVSIISNFCQAPDYRSKWHYQASSNSFYAIGKKKLTFEHAEMYCNELGSTLLSLKSSSEFISVQEMMTELAVENSWLGLQKRKEKIYLLKDKVGEENYKWTWLDGTIAQYHNPVGIKEASIFINAESEAMLLNWNETNVCYSMNFQGHWKIEENCDDIKMDFICKQDCYPKQNKDLDLGNCGDSSTRTVYFEQDDFHEYSLTDFFDPSCPLDELGLASDGHESVKNYCEKLGGTLPSSFSDNGKRQYIVNMLWSKWSHLNQDKLNDVNNQDAFWIYIGLSRYNDTVDPDVPFNHLKWSTGEIDMGDDNSYFNKYVDDNDFLNTEKQIASQYFLNVDNPHFRNTVRFRAHQEAPKMAICQFLKEEQKICAPPIAIDGTQDQIDNTSLEEWNYHNNHWIRIPAVDKSLDFNEVKKFCNHDLLTNIAKSSSTYDIYTYATKLSSSRLNSEPFSKNEERTILTGLNKHAFYHQSSEISGDNSNDTLYFPAAKMSDEIFAESPDSNVPYITSKIKLDEHGPLIEITSELQNNEGLGSVLSSCARNCDHEGSNLPQNLCAIPTPLLSWHFDPTYRVYLHFPKTMTETSDITDRNNKMTQKFASKYCNSYGTRLPSKYEMEYLGNHIQKVYENKFNETNGSDHDADEFILWIADDHEKAVILKNDDDDLGIQFSTTFLETTNQNENKEDIFNDTGLKTYFVCMKKCRIPEVKDNIFGTTLTKLDLETAINSKTSETNLAEPNPTKNLLNQPMDDSFQQLIQTDHHIFSQNADFEISSQDMATNNANSDILKYTSLEEKTHADILNIGHKNLVNYNKNGENYHVFEGHFGESALKLSFPNGFMRPSGILDFYELFGDLEVSNIWDGIDTFKFDSLNGEEIRGFTLDTSGINIITDYDKLHLVNLPDEEDINKVLELGGSKLDIITRPICRTGLGVNENEEESYLIFFSHATGSIYELSNDLFWAKMEGFTFMNGFISSELSEEDLAILDKSKEDKLDSSQVYETEHFSFIKFEKIDLHIYPFTTYELEDRGVE